MKRSRLRVDPDKVRAWQRRSRKPIRSKDPSSEMRSRARSVREVAWRACGCLDDPDRYAHICCACERCTGCSRRATETAHRERLGTRTKRSDAAAPENQVANLLPLCVPCHRGLDEGRDCSGRMLPPRKENR